MIECIRCHKEMDETHFFTKKDKTIFPICIECLNSIVNPHDPRTFMWILQAFDVPYSPQDWQHRVEYAFKHDIPFKIGKYLGQMKLASFKDYDFNDSGIFTQYYCQYNADQGWSTYIPDINERIKL